MAQKKNRQTRIHRYYYLVCLTEQGYPRYTGVFAHRADAVARAALLIENEQVATYKIVRLPDVSALECWCDNHGWKVDIDYQDGEVIAELERYSSGGVDFIMSVQPFTADAYREAVNGLDVNEEVLTLWNGDPTYRAAFGDLATAWNDINAMKWELVKQLNELNV